MKSIRPYIPAVVSGSALIFAFPVYDIHWLAWFSIAPFLLSISRLSLSRAFRAGVLMGVPYFFGTQYWIYHSVYHYGGVPFVVSILIVLLLTMYLSLYTGLFALAFSYKMKVSRLPALIVAPLFWVTLEFARSYTLTGFPWSTIGYTQYKFLRLIQFSDITGVYGVSFLVMSLNGAVADLFILRRRIKEMPLFPLSYTVAGYGLLLALTVSALLYGTYRVGEQRKGQPLRATIVQGNIEQAVKWNPAYQRFVMDTYKSMTLGTRVQGPMLIVWPETAVPFHFEKDVLLTEELIQFQRNLDSYLLFGAITSKDGSLSNSAILLDKTGTKTYVYDKIHLVPFGEYVPLRSVLFFINKLTVGIGDYEAGSNYPRAKTEAGEFGTLICYEIIFPGLVRKFYRDGGNFIVTITNDAWFGKTNGPYQHFSMAVLRAVENRKPVIRAANTGISGFIDSTGRVLKTTELFVRETLTAEIMTDGTRTLYSRYGDLFSYLCIIASVLLIMNIRR